MFIQFAFMITITSPTKRYFATETIYEQFLLFIFNALHLFSKGLLMYF